MAYYVISADWQTQFKNLDKCRQAFEIEKRLAKKYGCCGVFDLGDMKDEYTKGLKNV
jgi:hypothetical protein